MKVAIKNKLAFSRWLFENMIIIMTLLWGGGEGIPGV